MALSPSGYNTIGLPLVADAAVGGAFSVAVDTGSAGGSAPQAVAVTINQISAGSFGIVAAAGATQGGATPLPSAAQNVLVTVTASTEGVILPVASTGRVRRIFVPGTVGVKIYPPSGSSIDTGSANAAVTLAAGKGSIFIASDATHWKTLVRGA